ncbi:hypothetical protein [Candidatus Mycobacterium methanotrophicum]|uniref:Uncharacterized protein n=1 Tax=Candidatus Mycobacterium methanotrophicum TaxID=2943498 RepID=A0ABY4QI08_9MYCO|nr:hypothetical protein [Candidatus Mycobacterium methanotrophicum]UQX10181.1 hypothetical protein M5I08_18620 [Candidatus Mycobacterium methanotrophicum]
MSESRSLKADESKPVEEQLVYQGEVFINFRTSRQWVVIKLFALSEDVDDRAALELLLRHVRYRDSYAGTGDKDMVDIHGPYWLKAITPESFSQVESADAEALLRTWAEYATPLPDENRAELEHELYPRIRNAITRYQLADLRRTAEHDWGGVVGTTGFHEFVLIDRAAGSVALVVASDD